MTAKKMDAIVMMSVLVNNDTVITKQALELLVVQCPVGCRGSRMFGWHIAIKLVDLGKSLVRFANVHIENSGRQCSNADNANNAQTYMPLFSMCISLSSASRASSLASVVTARTH